MAQAWVERAERLSPLTVQQVWRFKNALGWEKFSQIAPKRIREAEISPEYTQGRTYV